MKEVRERSFRLQKAASSFYTAGYFAVNRIKIAKPNTQNLTPKKMTKLQVRAFLYQLGSFAILFISIQFLLAKYTNLTGLWIPMTAFVVGTILAPKFQAIKTKDGEKLFMKWMFVKGIRDIS